MGCQAKTKQEQKKAHFVYVRECALGNKRVEKVDR